MANTPMRSYRIPPDLDAAIGEEVAARHCSATDVVVRALREYFASDRTESRANYEYEEMPIG